MRVAPESYHKAERSLYIRMVVLFVVGVLAIGFAGFWVFIGGFAIIAPEHPDDRPIGVMLIIIGGGLPTLLAIALFVVGALHIRKISRFGRLVLLLRSSDQISPQSVAIELGITERAAEQLLFDALALGLIEDSKPTAEPRVDRFDEGSFSMARHELASVETPAPAMRYTPVSGGEETSRERPIPKFAEATSPVIQRRSGALGYGGDLSMSLSGTILNDTYQIDEPIGIGGMGAVYVARHVRTGKRYALKALLPDARFSEDAIRRFKREAAAASALGHRGIVAVHDFNVTNDGMHYLVCELLQGMTLEDRLSREGTLEWDDASSIIVQVSEALHAAHTEGILHRDLKPGNIYLDTSRGETERAVILDFGIAKQMDDVAVTKITISGTVVGTPLYMSPEQACSEKLDARADVYALGAVFYELLTGTPPFMADTIAGVYNRLLTEEAKPPTALAPHQLPPEIDELMVKVLAKEPSERFQTALDLAKAVREINELWDSPRDTAVDPLT